MVYMRLVSFPFVFIFNFHFQGTRVKLSRADYYSGNRRSHFFKKIVVVLSYIS